VNGKGLMINYGLLQNGDIAGLIEKNDNADSLINHKTALKKTAWQTTE
jgi:hypothetical protein